MGKINIKFGYPSSVEELENLSERAVFYDLTIEGELCLEFENTVRSLARPRDGQNFFDLVFLIAAQQQVIAPKAKPSFYLENGRRLPMIVLAKDYLVSVEDSSLIPISQEMLDEVGEIFQTEFDYEYVGFESVGT